MATVGVKGLMYVSECWSCSWC